MLALWLLLYLIIDPLAYGLAIEAPLVGEYNSDVK